MYAFRAALPEELKSVEEFNCVIAAYRKVHTGDEDA
jgi:hypothetical protein